MKYIRNINEYLKIYEELETPLFIDESNIKELLLKSKDFAEGDVNEGFSDIIYEEWKKHPDWKYSNITNWVEGLGDLPLLVWYINTYDYQLTNGGHLQYYENGCASSQKKPQYATFGTYSNNYDNIDIHENFVFMFKELGLDTILSETGKQAYSIISDFSLELTDDVEECSDCYGRGKVDCPECSGSGEVKCGECDGSGEVDDKECDECGGDKMIGCPECDGNGEIECSDCDGRGEIESGSQSPNTKEWDKLDTKWYEINDKFIKEFNEYLKTLTLDGEKIADLIEFANNMKKYNL